MSASPAAAGCRLPRLKDRMEHGLGWAVAGQALTPFEDIADNPWGPMTEVRQTPVAATHTRIDIWPDAQPFNFVLCDSMLGDRNWDCCTRGFYKAALAELMAETGLSFAAAFEHEFLLSGDGMSWTVPFSMEQMRKPTRFLSDLTRALTEAKVGLETVEPEYGINQYEISTAPAVGMAAAERAIITREVIRECARRLGLRATFTPKPTPASVGNGAHVHFSLVDGEGINRIYDRHWRRRGIIADGEAVRRRHRPPYAGAVRAASRRRRSPTCGSARTIGHAATPPSASRTARRRYASARRPIRATGPAAHNLEARPPDGTASPYMVLGALVRAGLSGIRQKLTLPKPLGRDPADLSDADRAAMGIRPLPGSLAEALDVMLADPIVAGWLPPEMRDSYVSVKRKEIALFADATPEAMCKRYHDAY